MDCCVLCGKPLSKGKVNREHYFGQVLIRNLNKLLVPKHYTHALRIDLRENGNEATLAVRSAHYSWATVLTHEKCNTDASPVCQDLKHIIDRMYDKKQFDTKRILSYYGHIWNQNSSDLSFTVLSDKQVVDLFEKSGDSCKIYQPGWLWAGKLFICNDRDKSLIGEEKHTIYLGTEDALMNILEDYQQSTFW